MMQERVRVEKEYRKRFNVKARSKLRHSKWKTTISKPTSGTQEVEGDVTIVIPSATSAGIQDETIRAAYVKSVDALRKKFEDELEGLKKLAHLDEVIMKSKGKSKLEGDENGESSDSSDAIWDEQNIGHTSGDSEKETEGVKREDDNSGHFKRVEENEMEEENLVHSGGDSENAREEIVTDVQNIGHGEEDNEEEIDLEKKQAEDACIIDEHSVGKEVRNEGELEVVPMEEAGEDVQRYRRKIKKGRQLRSPYIGMPTKNLKQFSSYENKVYKYTMKRSK